MFHFAPPRDGSPSGGGMPTRPRWAHWGQGRGGLPYIRPSTGLGIAGNGLLAWVLPWKGSLVGGCSGTL
jgi:hypothetical protein